VAPTGAGRRVLAVGVSLDHRRVDRAALAADEPFRDAAGDFGAAAAAGLIALGFRMSEARAAGLTELGLPTLEGAALGFVPSGWAPA